MQRKRLPVADLRARKGQGQCTMLHMAEDEREDFIARLQDQAAAAPGRLPKPKTTNCDKNNQQEEKENDA